MAVMTIRNIDNAIKTRLRIRAALHGKSMEEEARDILRSALSTEPVRPRDLGSASMSALQRSAALTCRRPDASRAAPPDFEA